MEEIARLVIRARNGDLTAFDGIVRRFQDMAVGYAYSLLGEEHGAEDAAQEAFLTAYREIARLRDPEAFPAWFRQLLKSQCHRFTRKKRPPHCPMELLRDRTSPEPGPHAAAEAEETQRAVRSAVGTLSEAEREVTVLYYMGGYAVKEVAAFLDLPVTTVKNRLHSARKQLKERLVHMEEGLREQRPSRDERFSAEVLAGVVKEFQRQHRADPLTADRSLLTDEKARLDEYLERGTVGPDVMRAAWALLGEMGESGAMAGLLGRYRSGPLPPEEEAWARWHEADLLAGMGRCEEAVALQKDLYRWAREFRSASPEAVPRIASDFPFQPLKVGDDAGVEALAPESLFLWVMGNGTMAQCWKEAGRADEWLAIFDQVMKETSATERNRFRRFNILRTATALQSWIGRPEEAKRIAGQIGALAEEEETWEEAQRWKVEEQYMLLYICSASGDMDGARHVGATAVGLIEEFERRFSPLDEEREGRLRSYCHNVGSPLVGAQQYDLAIPLFRRVVRDGRGSSWAYLRLAASLWATGGDREEVKGLLRQAECRHRGGNLLKEIESLPEFAPFAAEAEFAEALSM